MAGTGAPTLGVVPASISFPLNFGKAEGHPVNYPETLELYRKRTGAGIHLRRPTETASVVATEAVASPMVHRTFVIPMPSEFTCLASRQQN